MKPFLTHPILKPEDFELHASFLKAYLTGNWLGDLANFSAFVFHSLPNLNWAGFYLYDGKVLRLGPFVGKPACTEIKPGRGVCGTAFQLRKSIIVDDVNEFPGHIACDGDSRSELVLPLIINEQCIGVLDLDSPSLSRFSESDLAGVSNWLSVLVGILPLDTAETKPWA